MAEKKSHENEGQESQKSKGGASKSSSSKANPIRDAWEASGEYGHATEPDGGDLYDESAGTHIYPADIGYTVTSHGDGQPTMPPQYVTAREEEAERNADPDAPNREVARELGLSVD